MNEREGRGEERREGVWTGKEERGVGDEREESLSQSTSDFTGPSIKWKC